MIPITSPLDESVSVDGVCVGVSGVGSGNAEKRWFWWAGFDGEVENEGLYALGEFETRDQAIAAGNAEMPDTDGNRFFHIVEAQFADRLAGGDDGPDEFQPFAAMRKHELIEASEK